MQEYRYQAVDRTGKAHEGRILAESAEQAGAKIKQELGLVPVEIQEYVARVRRSLSIGGARKNFVFNFTQQLANLLNAGVQVDDALTILIQLTAEPAQKGRIQAIQEDIQGGADLSQALSKFPGLFNDSYISMIRAGESGGVLGLAAQRLTEYLEQDREFRSSVKSALSYPLTVIGVGILSVTFLFIFVVPSFSGIFQNMGAALPLPTRILLGVSGVFVHYWYLLLLGILLLTGGLAYYRSTPRGRYQLDRMSLSLPVIGGIQTKMAVSRFCRMLGTMMESGVPLLSGLEISKNTLSNQVFIQLIEELHEAVRKGGTISGFLKGQAVFPELAVFLIGVGERTGELEDMMKKVADTFQKEVKRNLDTFLTLLEPITILVLGVCVLFVVLAILLPMFTMNQMPFAGQ